MAVGFRLSDIDHKDHDEGRDLRHSEKGMVLYRPICEFQAVQHQSHPIPKRCSCLLIRRCNDLTHARH